MMALLNNIFKKRGEVVVVAEPVPDFSKQMVIIEPIPTEEEEEDDEHQI